MLAWLTYFSFTFKWCLQTALWAGCQEHTDCTPAWSSVSSSWCSSWLQECWSPSTSTITPHLLPASSSSRWAAHHRMKLRVISFSVTGIKKLVYLLNFPAVLEHLLKLNWKFSSTGKWSKQAPGQPADRSYCPDCPVGLDYIFKRLKQLISLNVLLHWHRPDKQTKQIYKKAGRVWLLSWEHYS